MLEEAIADWARQQQRAAEQLARVREDQLSDFEEESTGEWVGGGAPLAGLR